MNERGAGERGINRLTVQEFARPRRGEDEREIFSPIKLDLFRVMTTGKPNG